MKQKFYLFLMLAAALFTFSACGDDDDNGGGNAANFDADLSSLIDMSYSDMIKLYPEPSMSFDNYYFYNDISNTISGLSISINPGNQQVYHVIENLNEEAYAFEDIKSYFNKKFTFYYDDVDQEYIDDETAIDVTKFYYGNAEKEEDATLFIVVRDDYTIYYSNPKNYPDMPELASLPDYDPIEAVDEFMGVNIEDMQNKYPNAILAIGDNMYMGNIEDGTWLMGIALYTDDAYNIISMSLLYNEDLTDADVLNFYQNKGYTTYISGVDPESGLTSYAITNGIYYINYCDLVGMVSVIEE